MKLAPVEKPLLACRVCLCEIPHSVADSAEGREYVHYFCGADCYLTWINDDADDALNAVADSVFAA